MEDKNTGKSFLRISSLLALVVGAGGSLAFMFNAGRHQKSVVLIALFTAWVLSPFAGLFFAQKIYSRRAVILTSLYWLMIVLSVLSLVAYSGLMIPPGTKPAFIFLIAPFASWILIVGAILIARKHSQ